MKHVNVLLAICVGLVSLSAARAAEPILIGEISNMSGPLAVGGVPGRQGAILAVEEINQKGGVLGRPLQLVMRDDKTQPEEAGKAFRELAAQGVLLAMGTTGSATTAAMSSLARELKLPFFTMMGYSRFLIEEAGHRYFFRLITNDRVFTYAAAEALVKQPQTKYCTIASDFAYGRDFTKVFMTRLKEVKPDVEVLSGCEFWVPLGTTDLTPNLTAILARRPQAVLFGGLVGATSTAFVKQAKAFGVFANALGVHPTLGMQVNNSGLGGKEDVPEGIFTGADFLYPPTAASRAFLDAYRKRWNQLPTEQSANAYTTARFIAKAIEKAAKVDREAFIDAAEGLSIDHPGLGEITLRPFDHQSTAGWWMGYLAWDETNKRVGMRDAKYLKGDAYLPSKEEIEKIRSRKK
ncbi:MAG: ABC transporter substrate-binding protein [Betaproteobacteria bacterium]|nr:ABC transporter substrate-binding protein [Betaproteobacteria bacterium]